MTKAPLLLTQERGFGFTPLYTLHMRNKSIDNAVAWLLVLAGPFVAIFVNTANSTDPVNVPKMLVMSILAFIVLGLVLTQWRDLRLKEVRLVVIASGLFLLAIGASVVFSSAPLSQKFYGTYGRNTGFLTYASLLFLFLGSALVRQKSFHRKVVRGLAIVGVVNVLYGILQLTHNDPLPWNNTYGTILGTFGNPDFVSAFLGLSVVVCLAWLLGNLKNWKVVVLSVVYILTTLVEIKKSHAIQGLAITALGISVVGFFFIRAKMKSKWPTLIYLIVVLIAGITALFGALQKGPLIQFVYKGSVSLRGEYWAAAINTGKSHPLFGVGMDSFGDWYRRERRPSAIITPGANTVVNTAHNVFLDMLANGGLFLFISNLLIVALGAIAIFRVVRRTKKYDVTFVALAVAWIGYQAQAVISINQIGLAIWGWLLTGAVISYEISTREVISDQSMENQKNSKRNNRAGDTSLSPTAILAASIGGLVGLMLALPSFMGDSHYFTAMKSGKVQILEKAALANPKDSNRLANTANLLIQNKFNDRALVVAREAVKFNPSSSDAWNLLYAISLQTPIPEAEKAKALAMLKMLDPLNPDVQKLK